MAEFDMNNLVDRVQVYDSFVQMVSGADKYRFKSLQVSRPIRQWPDTERIADDGALFLNQQVINHRYEMDLVLTADEFDTANPPTNVKTLSYFKYRKDNRFSVLVNVVIVYYAKDASTNKYLRDDFSFELQEIGTPRVTGDGDVAVNIKGRILLVNPATGAALTSTMIRAAS